MVDVKAEALKSAAAAALEPVIELEVNELQSEPDDDNAATGDSRKIQRTVKQVCSREMSCRIRSYSSVIVFNHSICRMPHTCTEIMP